MDKVYYDRRGKEYTPQKDAAFKDRSGVFGIVIVKDSLLVSWPYNEPSSVDLPGGGIEAGETIEQALIREFYEETGLRFDSISSDKTHEQDISYYAQDQDEFWNYHQRFEVLPGALYEEFHFAGRRDTPEGGFASWEKLSDLGRLDLQFFHRQALQHLGIV